MRVCKEVGSRASFFKKGCAVALGNYDGVHLGHRAILNLLKREANKRHLPSVLYTFHPHPVKALAPKVAPPLLNTPVQKIELLKDTGLDAMVIQKFTPQFARHSPEEFFKRYLVDRLHARFIIVGYDFTFGAKRLGNIETLERLCFKAGIECKIVDARLKGATLVSSSLIRKYVTDGKVKEVIPLLTRPYFIDGKIIRGYGRGKTIGVPTANLKTENELLPKNGVYATTTVLGGKTYNGVTNIGLNPTFNNRSLSIETHWFNFKGDARGRRIRLYFNRRLRDERRFSGVNALTAQIKRDMARAKKHP